MSEPFHSPSMAPTAQPDSASESPATTPGMSAAMARFKSCRWRRPPDEGAECCGHRDVLPLAGTTGFDPEAWCLECAFYKLRRTPKKRNPEDYRY
ncbi:MAG TPA: hypothetical protein VM818_24885 [Vicinamibacterales bacterium]|nr:hypothetical protein [Vicinamibacterales bacterium]